MDYAWDFSSLLTNGTMLLIGLRNTLALWLTSLLLGFFFGGFVGAARYARNRFLNWPASAFIEVFRNTPVLVQIMWFFFAFPILSPLDIDAFTAAALALTLNTTAFAAEIYRGGIQSIHKGQWEAGQALGMSYSQQMTRIILPQAIRRMIPAFMNRAVELMKMTALASTVAYGELMYQAKTISTISFNPIEMYTGVGLIFFVMIFPIALFVQRLERRLRSQADT